MAEAVFNHIVGERGEAAKWVVDSAATSNYNTGSSPDSRTVAVCKKRAVKISHEARQVTKEDYKRFKYILCMDNANLRDLKALRPKDATAHIALLGQWDPKGSIIIEDPYYGDSSDFVTVFDQCHRSVVAFLDDPNRDAPQSSS